MVVRFDFTVQAMASNRWLTAGMAGFGQASARLGSGLRINAARDDAAGLSLSSRMHAQSVGWHRAQRNVQEGLLLAHTVDGAFSTLGEITGRMRELAIQSANGIYSAGERAALQREVEALRAEITRVVEGTRFNGITLLKGTENRPAPNVDPLGALNGTVTFDGVTLTGGSMATPALLGGIAGPNSAFGTRETQSGTYEVVITQPPEGAAVAGGVPASTLPGGAGTVIQLSIVGPLGSVVVDLAYGSTPGSWVTDINALTGTTGVSAALEQLYGPPDEYLVLRSTGAGAAQRITVRATTLDPLVAPEDYVGFGPGAVTGNGTNLVATINGAAASVGGTATQTLLRLVSPGNAASGIALAIDSNPLAPGYTTGPFPFSAGWVNVEAFATQIDDLALLIHSGPNEPNAQPLTIKPMITGAMAMTGPDTVGTIDISTQLGALAAIDVLDSAATQVSEARAALGGSIRVLDAALGVAGAGAESEETGRARIVDADIAEESVALLRSQMQTETSAVAAAHVHADAARTLQLITDSRVATRSIPETREDAATPPNGDATRTASAAAPPALALEGAPSSTSTSIGASTIGYTPVPVLPTGFTPLPATPGYQPLPVLGSSSLGAGASGLSTSDMLFMIQSSLL